MCGQIGPQVCMFSHSIVIVYLLYDEVITVSVSLEIIRTWEIISYESPEIKKIQ